MLELTLSFCFVPVFRAYLTPKCLEHRLQVFRIDLDLFIGDFT